MKTVSWEDFLSSAAERNNDGYAASIGSFDGVHLGHRRLLETLKERSHAAMIASVVITFRENPKRILRPEHYQGDISSLRQRLERLGGSGIDICVLIDYDRKFGAMTGMEFLDVLKERTGLLNLVMGQNARLGLHAAMDSAQAIEYAKKLGIAAEIVPSLVLADRAVSSSRIRGAVLSGNMAEAAELLGYPFELDLESCKIRENQGSCELVSPRKMQIMPPVGRYAIEYAGQGGIWKTAMLDVSGAAPALALVGADGLPSRLRFV
jgi:riboflavin kinase / FMN adenylyltransferase